MGALLKERLSRGYAHMAEARKLSLESFSKLTRAKKKEEEEREITRLDEKSCGRGGMIRGKEGDLRKKPGERSTKALLRKKGASSSPRRVKKGEASTGKKNRALRRERGFLYLPSKKRGFLRRECTTGGTLAEKKGAILCVKVMLISRTKGGSCRAKKIAVSSSSRKKGVIAAGRKKVALEKKAVAENPGQEYANPNPYRRREGGSRRLL